MDLASWAAVNGPNVIHETIEGEAVIINLMSGRYYSLQGTAAEIWDLIGEGATVSVIVAAMAGRYAAAGVDMQDVVISFLGRLREEELIRVEPASEPVGREIAPAKSITASPAQSSGFELPALQVYTDLEDLLLLDPIHEVDDEGWPVAKPGGSPET